MDSSRYASAVTEVRVCSKGYFQQEECRSQVREGAGC